MVNTYFATDGKIGIKLDKQLTGTTTDGAGAEHKLGTRVTGSDGTDWVYVQAGAAITQYMFVGIDENFQASPLTAAMAGDGWAVGVAESAFSNNDIGWVALAGHNLTGRVAASCAADAALKTTATAGVIDDNTSGTALRGVVAVAANTTTAAKNVEVLLTYPRSATF